MRRMMNDKRGIIMWVFIVIGILIAIYLILFLPIPAFKKIRAIINYFSIFILFLAIQGGVIYAYYKVGTYVSKGIQFYNKTIMNLTMNIHRRIEQTQMR